MDTLLMRQQLQDYIMEADDEKVEAMYESVKDEIAGPYEWWNDEELVAELHRRSAALKSGEDKGFTLDESRASILARRKKHA